MTRLNVDQAVRERYSEAARATEPSLCCPTSYDASLLEAIPAAVLERDYGCGNPAAHVGPGETVLDLGSGSGTICFIASQVVGPTGTVIGVDTNDEMLALARASAPEVARKIGHDNVRFVKGRIQDLGVDLEQVEDYLREQPIASANDLARLEHELRRLRREQPLIADESVDVVVSNCVLNLVDPGDKRLLFREIVRVLKPGGRAVISDIVSDRDVPLHLQQDPELWSGCISGALREDQLPAALATAGLAHVDQLARADQPWRTVEGIEFRSMTVVAYKGAARARGGSAAGRRSPGGSCC